MSFGFLVQDPREQWRHSRASAARPGWTPTAPRPPQCFLTLRLERSSVLYPASYLRYIVRE